MGGLLSQIQTGTSLKKVEAVEKPPPSGESMLLSQIQKGIALKKASERTLAEKKDDGPMSVADILARRIAIVGDSDGEDDDDWGDDDDDWSE